MKLYFDANEKLEYENQQLMEELNNSGINKLQLTSFGNSISTCFSIVNKNQPLLNRNETLKKWSEKYNIELETYNFARSENNNDEHIFQWLLENKSLSEFNKENRRDYHIYNKKGKNLLTEEEINTYYPESIETDRGVREVILENKDTLANIVILNSGTGSWIDNCARKGKHILTTGIKKDLSYTESILGLIQWHNRTEGSNTQVYLCGAPRLVNTFVSNHFINNPVKKRLTQYANVTYVPNFKRQAFYQTKEGFPLPEPHYNENEYLHLLGEVEHNITENYKEKRALIEIDRYFSSRSREIEMSEERTNTKEEILSFIEEQAQQLEGRKYNSFLKHTQTYLLERYPYDYYYLDHKAIANSAKVLSKKK